MQDYTDLAAAVEVFQSYPHRLVAAYTSMTLEIAKELTAVQYARLLLSCRPFLPDYIELCSALLPAVGLPQDVQAPSVRPSLQAMLGMEKQ